MRWYFSARRGYRHGVIALWLLTGIIACAPVGPEYTRPQAEYVSEWQLTDQAGIKSSPTELVQWWQEFKDPVLDHLVQLAHEQNYSLEVAGLKVLESRAQLGIATGNRYPQTQFAAGSATYLDISDNTPNTGAGGDLDYWQYGLGLNATWEADFWGKFRRSVEAADAALAASIANYDGALVLLSAQVADTYTAIRTGEEQLRIAHQNVIIQQRSYDIAEVLYRNGSDSELDMQQAKTLLLGTQATIPQIEASVRRAKYALSVLLSQPPTELNTLLGASSSIPALPAELKIGIPADLLRRRPDVRRAEMQAMAQNALVGVAEANLYPSFTLSGSIGLSATSSNTTASGESGLGELFSSDSFGFSGGPAFTWPFFNYDRIKNSIRVEDARLQQALLNYKNTVLVAAAEVQDAIAAYNGTQLQESILLESVESAKRSNELSTLRYREGFADYQRVLDSQQSLFTRQAQYVDNLGASVRNVVAMYKALGGGWHESEDADRISEESRQQMQQRTDWEDYLE